MESISQQLRRRREELGLSQAEVARRAGTSPATISRYESGWDRFEVYTLQKLASALECRLGVNLTPLSEAEPKPRAQAVVEKLERLFWDVELTVDHLDEYASWVVGRVLEYGAMEDVHLLMSYLGRDVFLRTVSNVRFSSRRTKIFWEHILHREGIECTKKSCQSTVIDSWKR
ncbi:MAG: helix-turn-helix domain-containing protein [Planctomycetota bacterium]